MAPGGGLWQLMARLEVCIDTAAGLIACAAGCADRIELCSALSVGGLTPSIGLIRLAAAGTIPAHAMIRPEPGGFVYSTDHQRQMLADIVEVRAAGLAGVVIGALTRKSKLDTAFLADAIAAADGIEVTLHRAIDLMDDPVAAVDDAIALGFTRILTSGGAPSAKAGTAMIRAMDTRAAGRITIMAGSGITPGNVVRIMAMTGVSEIHASCTKSVMQPKKVPQMGFGPAFGRKTDAAIIRAMRAKIYS